MNTIDYVYRFDPKNPSTKPPPPDAEAARQNLEDGNRMFAQWMESCQSQHADPGEEPRYVVQCNGLEVGMVRKQGGMPKQAPFAVVVGCSDARVPTEMLFGQGFNDLFVIRVAGNVLGDVCLGSIDFAVEALSESVKVRRHARPQRLRRRDRGGRRLSAAAQVLVEVDLARAADDPAARSSSRSARRPTAWRRSGAPRRGSRPAFARP